MFTKGPIGHVVIDKDHLTLLIAASDKRDEVNVSKLREHLNLTSELMGTLS